MGEAERAAGGGAAPTATFILRVRLDGQDSPSGSIGLPDDPDPLSFSGWIDLMSALNRLRTDLDPRGPLPPP
jgi:hypothetical protein